ncbi:MAG: hypothetical protein RR321_04480 [Acidaminococcaceae bacterium]
MGELELQIEWQVRNISELKELVKMVEEIRKEYSCNCTLLVKNQGC